MTTNVALWIYLALMVAGGLMGFLKAGSKASLIASVAFAVPLALAALGVFGGASALVARCVVGFLLVFFGAKFAKGRKFMPAGMMTILSAVTLVLLFVLRAA
ncbi:MAG: hypothetical protein HZA89_12190 [Verrucomicrobia bacterium]|nr:hypothetical protein [Verrucomicrobiota bacterium]